MTDSGSIVLGWLTKLIIGLALFGVLIFDGISLLTSNMGAADDASLAARAAAEDYKANRNVQLAYDAAANAVLNVRGEVETETFAVNADRSVTLVVRKEATTFWMHYIGPLKKYTHIRQAGSGNPPS